MSQLRTPEGFEFWVEDDRLRVRFIARRNLGFLTTGHAVGGDYGDGVIRLPRYETRDALRPALMHELGHYLCRRHELDARKTTEEDICDLLSWLPAVLKDTRNNALRLFLGL